MSIFGYTPAQVRKTVVAFLAFLLNLVMVADPLGLIPEEAKPYVALFVGLAGTYGVFAVRNVKPTEPYTQPEALD